MRAPRRRACRSQTSTDDRSTGPISFTSIFKRDWHGARIPLSFCAASLGGPIRRAAASARACAACRSPMRACDCTTVRVDEFRHYDVKNLCQMCLGDLQQRLIARLGRLLSPQRSSTISEQSTKRSSANSFRSICVTNGGNSFSTLAAVETAPQRVSVENDPKNTRDIKPALEEAEELAPLPTITT